MYLDQFVWIGLSQAANQRPNGAAYADALEMCRAARAHGKASFPLDLYRYWETAKRGDSGSRNRLVNTMIELSDFDSMLTSHRLLDYELDMALNVRFGRPSNVVRPRIFGRGISHATGGAVHNAARPANEQPPSSDPSSDLRTPIDRALEEVLLRAGPDTHARAGLPLNLVDWGDLYAQHEVKVATDIAARSVPRDQLLAAVTHADFYDIAPAISRRLEAAGISKKEVDDVLGNAGLLQLVHSAPTRRVTNVLRASKHVHTQPQQRWKKSDFIDVIALPAPVVYCDVVFTEKEWVTALTRDKRDPLDKRFNTRLISKPDQLVSILAAV